VWLAKSEKPCGGNAAGLFSFTVNGCLSNTGLAVFK
jgi:hypothetical protein